MSRRLVVAFAAVSMLLTGCLIPERFNAKAEFQPDGSYSFTYAGTAVHAMAAMQLAKAGKLTAKDDESLEREVAALKRNPDVRRATYKGNGRYDLALESKRKSGQALDVLSIFTVRTGKDGVITIASGELDEKGKKQLAQLGIKLDGTLDITVPKNAEVLSHNATSAPSLLGLVGTYSWKIGSIEQRPFMKIRMKS
ncbi:hypothetical protein GJ697_02935 [Pseudoduganella sp. FT25W]|uniref:Uncharacterized protein n=1 Tax=Duganella alba TaxID=2666081 RepID=A0A6L5QAF1_9BURK|nr:hypothetical protein [Duganella alba]MRX06783.1 hypothetical protein [Duganella alba]MRX18415.1 hypothetical protein [Duganella alba]